MQSRKPGHDEFARKFEGYRERLVSRNRWTPLNPMQVLRLRHSWPALPGGILPPDAAEKRIPEMRGLLLSWEESVRWIARGWDGIEEYTHDVWARLSLEEGLDDCLSFGITLPECYLKRLAAIDRTFKRMTHDSRLCCLNESEYVYDQSPGFFRRQEAEFPKRKYWFLYRWQNGTNWRAPPLMTSPKRLTK